MCPKVIVEDQDTGVEILEPPRPELPPFIDKASQKILDESFEQDLLPGEAYKLLVNFGLSRDPELKEYFFQHLSRLKSESETFVKSKEWLAQNVEDSQLRKELENCVRLGIFSHLPTLQDSVQKAKSGPGGLGAYVYGQGLQELVLQTKSDRKVILNYFNTTENRILPQQMMLDLWSMNGILLLRNISEKIQKNALKFEDDIYYKTYGVDVPEPAF